MRFVPLGVGDAFSEHNYSSCVALEHGGQLLLVDCPHPILKMLREARDETNLPIDAAHVAGIVLTHLHADHASGVETFAYYARFVLGRKVRLAAHPIVLSRLWDGHLAAGMERSLPALDEPFRQNQLEDFFDIIPLREDGAVEVGPFSVEARQTIHHIPCAALRLGAGGRMLGHSADTTFDEGLLAWLGVADLVLHETGYGVHTAYELLAALPAELRAKMRLIHYPDALDRERSAIEPLRERIVYNV